MGISPDILSRAPEKTLREIIREAESHLSSQLSAGLAANSRVMSITGFLTATTVVLGGSASTLLLSDHPRTLLGSICAGVAIGLLAATGIAIKAATPTVFWYPGNRPAQWLEDIKKRKSLRRSLAEQAAYYDMMIEKNVECMELSDRRLRIALHVIWGTLVAGGIATVSGYCYGTL